MASRGRPIESIRRPITLVLLGDIAAGKGTQAKILAKKFRLHHIDTGHFSRQMAKRYRSFERVKNGRLAPSAAIQKYLKTEITGMRAHQGVLLDGGKMPAEARLVYRLFRQQHRRVLVIYLTIPQAESFRRALGRVRTEVRADDSLEALRNRIKYYRDVYSKTISFWKRLRVLKTVSGSGTIPQITRSLVRVIERNF